VIMEGPPWGGPLHGRLPNGRQNWTGLRPSLVVAELLCASMTREQRRGGGDAALPQLFSLAASANSALPFTANQ
jgi:hypothetical protein